MEWQPLSPPGSVLAVAVALLLLLPGCGGNIPSAPPQLSTGIVVYEHGYFKGQSGHITRDFSDLGSFSGACEHQDDDPDLPSTYDWADCISSVRVAPGWRATLYRDTHYQGATLDITADVPSLELMPGPCEQGGMNDCVSSIRVSTQ